MLEDNPLVIRIVSRFHIIVTVIVALLAAAVFGSAAGEGDFYSVYLGIFIASFVAIVLALGDKYWLLIPISFTTELPAIPIKGRLLELPEVAAVLCSATFLVRYAVKRQTFTLFRAQHAPFLLYTGWVILIFLVNPVGFSDAGSSLGGARFYAKILLGLAAFLIMANQEMTDQDCKWVIVLWLMGSFVDSLYQAATYFLPGYLGENVQLFADPDSFYSWHQALSGVPIMLTCLAFARYRASDLFSLNRVWTIAGLGLCVLVIAMSGKRAAIASVPLFAIVAALTRREWGYLILWLTGAVLAGSIIVIGHGDLFHLPLTVQRAFSALPAQWDSELGDLAGGKDLFRAELRRKALQKIEKDPWIGDGYQVNLSLAQALTAQYATRGGDTELQVEPFAIGSAWHNTWLGYAADFGIPASIIAALIFFSVIRTSYRLTVKLPARSMRATLATYIFLITVVHLFRSHTSGHSALDPFSRWWAYGVLVSLWVSHRELLTSNTPGPLSIEARNGRPMKSITARSSSGSRPRGARADTLVAGSSRPVNRASNIVRS
jgi:hypothetical protein